LNSLDVWNDDLEPEQKTKVLRENFSNINKAIQSTALLLPVSRVSRASQSITSTSYVNLAAWQTVITTQGGVVFLVFETYVIYDGAGNIGFQLLIDGQPTKEIFGMGLAGNHVVQNSFSWAGQLPAGSHLFGFQAKVNAGTQIVGNASSDSTLYILEYARG